MKKKFLFLLVSLFGGMYLSTKEGRNTQKKINDYAKNLKPQVTNLLNQAKAILEGSKTIDSETIRVNVEQQVNNVRNILSKVKPEDAGKVAEKVVQQASRILKSVRNDVKIPPKTKRRLQLEKMTLDQLVRYARQRHIKVGPRATKKTVIDKIIR